MALACPSCETAAAEYVGMADDGRNEMRCTSCDHHWLLGAKPVSPRAVVPKPSTARSRSASSTTRSPASRTPSGAPPTRSRASAPRTHAAEPAAPPAPVVSRMPTLDDVPDAARRRLAEFKAAWPRERPRPDPYAADYRRLHELMFSPAGLPHAEPGPLRDFVTSDVLALSGSTTSFTREWRRLGDRDASRRFRGLVEYLLRGEDGSDDPPLEDRFTALIEQRSPYAMSGVRERVLTRILVVAQPDRFLPVLTVDGDAGGEGKRELVRSVLGLELPDPERARHGIGEVACAANDLLVDALGAGFADLDDAAAFLLAAHARV